MANYGYVKLYRQLLDNPVFLNEKLLKVWIWCLLTATHSERKVAAGNTIIDLKPGQFVFGRKRAAMENNLSESTFYRMMNTLKDLKMLTLKTSNKWTVATIENWGLYQDCSTETEQQESSKRTQNKNDNNIYKKFLEKPSKSELPDRKKIPPTLDMVTEYCSKRKNNVDPQYFIDYYTARDWHIGKTKMKDWQAAIRTWEKNDKERTATHTLSANQEVKRYDV